ncbi:MAG: HlyC/CorC family transporter [Verrucomicrobia bacterium]|nr:HlyC/CorC family transporter [Verrucomicrobiota bacterium]MBI3870394.1 HlyC/CorC family transporter [Verrucomicrobiota bacterium]
MGLMAYLVVSGILICAAASFFFALAETALFALGKMRARQLGESTSVEGRLVARMLEQPMDLLGSIVLGNTLANAGIVALSLAPVLSGEWPLGATLVSAFLTVLLWGEVLPKTLAVRSPERWALWIARPMFWVEQLARPFQKVFQSLNARILATLVPRSIKPQNLLTDQDYHELLDMAFQQGALAQREKDIILQVIGLDQKTARDVMRPRSSMASISAEATLDEMLEAARRHRRRRLPLYDQSPDTIVGILDTQKLLLDPQGDLDEAIELPSFVPETMNLLKLLHSLQRQKRGLVVVLDEFGGAAGIVRLEDILAEIIGVIRDEGEVQGFLMERLGRGKWRVNATMRLDDFRREYPALGEVEDVDTLGGLVLKMMEVVPLPGQSVRCFGLKLTVRQAEERRIRELLVEEVHKSA